jgi:S1-C subfamily serine protease
MAGLAIGGIIFAISPAAAKDRSATPPLSLSIEAIAAKALPALVTVLIKDARGQLVKSGSGFFVEPKRLITNMHVIRGGGMVSVVTLDKREFAVASARTDEEHDLALLEVPDAVKVNTLPLGDPEAVAIGESVAAAGSPLGMQGTVSAGIVSAKRIVKGVAVIQTTAPISPGSSGGPLINSQGEVIGVNSFMAAEGQNLNFAHLSSHIAALRAGGGKSVDFRRGETITAKSDAADPNLSLLAQASFSGTEFKQGLIGNAELVLLDARQ